MCSFVSVLVVFIIGSVVSTHGKFTNEKDHDEFNQYLWKEYKQSFHKSYSTDDEETSHYKNFLENLKVIDERNALERVAGGSAIHGITKFSDLSQDQFKATYLTVIPNTKKQAMQGKVSNSNVTATFVDWTGVYTTPVKDQGYCGSCWAFSATEQIESDAIRTLDVDYILSPEQIVECDTIDYGCRGGNTETAYAYVKSAGGIELDATYPYTSYYGKTGRCSADRALNVVSLESYYTLASETDMAAYVQSTGPLSVCVDASNWNSYTAGIMKVCGKSVDHCVQAVGVYPAQTDGYWKVRNSWGYAWGEAGYIKLSYGDNTCAIARDPTYTSVSLTKN